MGNVMIINYDICNGCYNCQIACKDEHVGNDWLPIAKQQPDTGQFWHKVYDNVRGQVPKVKITYEHSICQHCDVAPCMEACPVMAIYKRTDGIVIIDPNECDGCSSNYGKKMCIEACPYRDVLYFNEGLNIAQKCTFCAHLLDNGWKEPRCVDACPTGALTFGDETNSKIKEQMSKAQPLKPELKVKPRVLYIGLPRKFIAGAVYDFQKNECVGGAEVILVNIENGEKLATKTDIYGDFWFKELKEGVYTLIIKRRGYQSRKVGPVDVTKKDINVGIVSVLEKVTSSKA